MGTVFELSRIGAERTLNHGWAPRLQYDYDSNHVGALELAGAPSGAPQLVIDLYEPDDPRLWARPVAQMSIGYLVPGERVVPALGRPVAAEPEGPGEGRSSPSLDPVASRSPLGTPTSGRDLAVLLRYLPVDVLAAYTAAVVLLRNAAPITLGWLTALTVVLALVVVAAQAWITARRTADQHRTARPGLLRAMLGSWWELVATAIAVVVWSAALPNSWANWPGFAETVSFGGWTAAAPGVVAFATSVVAATALLLGTSVYQEWARGRATRAVLRRPDTVIAVEHDDAGMMRGALAGRLARRRARKAASDTDEESEAPAPTAHAAAGD